MRILAIISTVATLAACADAKFQGNNGGDASRDTRNDNPQIPIATNTNTNTTVTPSTPGVTEFGTPPTGLDLQFGSLGDAWHLGDNNYKSSDCKARINLNAPKGKSFNYAFYVQNDATQVSLSVGHCGVDTKFADLNKVSLAGPTADQNYVGAEIVKFGLKSPWINFGFLNTAKFPNRLTLNRGWYRIRVESGLLGADYDDFVVGNVKLSSPSGPITLGNVTGD